MGAQIKADDAGYMNSIKDMDQVTRLMELTLKTNLDDRAQLMKNLPYLHELGRYLVADTNEPMNPSEDPVSYANAAAKLIVTGLYDDIYKGYGETHHIKRFIQNVRRDLGNEFVTHAVGNVLAYMKSKLQANRPAPA